ncbi:hypothetical protein Patl1_12356 [Pistacia atlantica]|uniref:Uncharacterized protein n=1 Tax=Pistacia atlantica TaxID=434234 RepID=A0ACC1A4G3_9ROSI|nr:hypothetical protein Patl1_12356 [Pistacia atlantica]
MVDGSWDENYLVELVGLDKTLEIMNGVVVGKVGTDITIWKPNIKGDFMSAFVWDLIRVKGTKHLGMDWIWHHVLLKKIFVCMWKACFNGLALDSRVQSLGILLASRCNYCTHGHTESLNHVLCNGSIAAEVWKTAAITLGINHVYGLSWWSTVMQWFNVSKKSSHRGVLLDLILSIITWHLWMRRCKARMENLAESADNVWLAVKVWIRKISSLMVKQWPISTRDEVILRALEMDVVGATRAAVGKKVSFEMRGIFKGTFSSSFGHGTNNEAELRVLLAVESAIRDVHFTINHQLREGNRADFLARQGEEVFVFLHQGSRKAKHLSCLQSSSSSIKIQEKLNIYLAFSLRLPLSRFKKG